MVSSLRSFSRLSFKDKTEDLSDKSHLPSCLLQEAHILFYPLDVYESLITFLHSIGYEDGKTLFVFCYDWRHSAFDAAAKLDEYIKQDPVLSRNKFDVLTHSMGGIVGRVFLQEGYQSSANVQNYIEVAVPHKGSVATLIDIYEGWGAASRALAGIDNIRKVIWTFDSFFEMMPTYDGCCAHGYSPPNTPQLDLRKEDDWRNLTWLFDTSSDSQTLIHHGVERLNRIRQVLDKPWPPQVRPFVFAGGGKETAETVYVLNNEKKLVFRYSKLDGDETVLKDSSRAFNEIPYPTLAKHRNSFNDNSLQLTLEDVLLEKKQRKINGKDIYYNGKLVLAIATKLNELFVEPKSEIRFSLAIDLSDAENFDAKDGTIKVISKNGSFVGSNLPLTGKIDRRTIHFEASIVAPEKPGTYTLGIEVPGIENSALGSEDPLFVVVPKASE